MPVDDGGPQTPTPAPSSRLGFDLAALAVLVAGGLGALALWRRGGGSLQVGGVVAGTLALAAGVVVVPAAFAAEPAPRANVVLSEVVAATSVAEGKTATVTASCPAGSVLVGGGLRTTPDAAATTAHVSVSQPTAGGWQVTATAGSEAPVTLTAVAECTSNRGVEPVLATGPTVALPSGSSVESVVGCPDGQPLAVGWNTGTASPVAVLPLQTGGIVSAWARTDGAALATTTLHCTGGAATVDVLRSDEGSLDVVSGGVGESEATCPAGFSAVGGGYTAAARYGGRLAAVTPMTAAPEDDGYVVRVQAEPGGPPLQLSVYALCLPTA
ncbi:MAG TPA: hypothetical protein VEV13_07290 [Candidatus Limnocylindria bacterium]|nr:hypothetical protein [Candidatus Limnocylindria bacterium]